MELKLAIRVMTVWTGIVVAVLVGIGLLGAGRAFADSYTVETTADPTNAPCPSATAVCSLRQLILYADAHSFPPDTITVPAGTYTLNPSFGALVVSNSVSIVGAGANDTMVAQPQPGARASTGDHVFYIAAVTGGVTPTVAISGLEVSGGDANCTSAYGQLPVSSCFGGDIFNAGTLTLSEDWITNGFACSGGGVANYEGATAIERSLVSGNHAACGGGDSGAINNVGCPTTGSSAMPDCTVDLPGHLVIENSTVALNDARLVGGVFSWNDPNNTLRIANSTIASNSSQDEPSGTARGLGGGLGLSTGIARVENSILASNVETTTGSTTPTNCAPGPGIASFGRNIDSGTDCHLSDTVPNQADQSDTNPLIGPLQNNGGSTMTMALLPGSPALDKVPTTGAGCPTTDQRGIPRPQGPACDIGAFELQVQPPIVTSPPVISATSGGPPGASTPGPSPVAMTPAAMISASQIVASLARQLHLSGKAAKIAALLGNNGLAVSVSALEAGTAAIAWYYLPPGAKLARSRKPQPTLVASARLTFSAAGTKTAKLKLTFAGKLLLEHAHRIKLTAQDTFTPTGEKAVMVTGTFVLVR